MTRTATTHHVLGVTCHVSRVTDLQPLQHEPLEHVGQHPGGQQRPPQLQEGDQGARLPSIGCTYEVIGDYCVVSVLWFLVLQC